MSIALVKSRDGLKYADACNVIGGKRVNPEGARWMEVTAPQTGEAIAQVALSTAKDLDKAVTAAKAALPGWAATPIKQRVQVLFAYRNLLEKHRKELTALVSEENGKTLPEAEAEVDKAIEMTEFACSLPQIAAGEILEVSKGVECRSVREPVGVVASIVPFNFPLMVPNWTLPNALALGNAMIMKPSEQVPLSCMRVAELLKEAGLPDGVFNIVQGDREIVEAICDHPGIDAVSFVGSTRVAKIVYARAAGNLKRALALGGAKNHLLVLPDAEPEMTATNVVASMSGCAGQRCMAASAMVAVGEVEHIIARIPEIARTVTCGANLGAVISQQARERIEGYIAEAEKAGAKVLVDGRDAKVPGREGGFYVGATVIDHVTPDMKIAKEEVFGPVLAIIRAKSVEEAVAIQNASEYGNGASVYTQDGGMAAEVASRLTAGMVGVNIGVPVPREPFAFGGWKDSKFGVGDITGKSSIEFWTKPKKITTKWNIAAGVNWMS